MEPQYKPSHQIITTSQKIIKWLSTQSKPSLKSILTIKHPKFLQMLKNMLYYKDQRLSLPSQLKQLGFSYLKDQKRFITRPKYRVKIYDSSQKQKKQQLNQLIQKLYENIIISRNDKFHVTIRQVFFDDLRKLIRLITSNMAFYSKGLDYNLKGEQICSLPWFEVNTHYHSLAEWIIYFIERQILWAYNKKDDFEVKNQIFQYVQQIYSSPQNLDKLLEKIIINLKLQKQCRSKLNQNQKNQLNFYKTKCKDRLSQMKHPLQYLIWLNWMTYNPNNSYEQIFNQASLLIHQQFKIWQSQKCARQLQQQKKLLEQKKREKNKRNKLKKAQKKKQKNTENRKQMNKSIQVSEQQTESILEQVRKQIQFVNQQIIKNSKHEQQSAEENKLEINKEVKQKKKKKKNYIEKSKILKKEQDKIKQQQIKADMKLQKKIQKQKDQQNSCSCSQISYKQSYGSSEMQNMEVDAKLQRKKMTQIRNRINQSFDLYKKQLDEKSIPFQKYRKTIVFLIQTQISHLFSLKLKNVCQKNPINWKLQVFGSSAANFSLKQSDIDLVLLQNHHPHKICLQQLYEQLSLKQWTSQCKLYLTAQVPIVTFTVNPLIMITQYSNLIAENQLMKINNKTLSKIQNQSFVVDLSLWDLQQKEINKDLNQQVSQYSKMHTGIRNTNILQKLFSEYPQVRNTCLILKQFMRVRNLHKPYKGGISSYVLVMMVYIILHNKGLLKKLKKDDETNYYKFFTSFCEYMAKSFIPFQTVVKLKRNVKSEHEKKNIDLMEDNKKIHLKIQCPYTGMMLKTSAFQIEKIIENLQDILRFLKSGQIRLGEIKVQQKKKMKKQFTLMLQQFIYQPENKQPQITNI